MNPTILKTASSTNGSGDISPSKIQLMRVFNHMSITIFICALLLKYSNKEIYSDICLYDYIIHVDSYVVVVMYMIFCTLTTVFNFTREILEAVNFKYKIKKVRNIRSPFEISTILYSILFSIYVSTFLLSLISKCYLHYFPLYSWTILSTLLLLISCY
jgi:hypothetical protein